MVRALAVVARAGSTAVASQTAALLGPSRKSLFTAAAAASSSTTTTTTRFAAARQFSSSTQTSAYHRFGSREERAEMNAAKMAETVNPIGKRNYEIPFTTVQLVDPVTNQLDSPQSRQSILRNLNLDTHALVCVQSDPPVVKLIDLEAERDAQRMAEARDKQVRKIAMDDKEVQVAWHSASGDLQTKLQKAKGMLEKGDRVHLVFATRAQGASRKVRLTDEQRQEIVAVFDTGLATVGRKRKADEVKGGLWVCYWEPQEVIREGVRHKVLEEEVAKKKSRDDKKEARRLKEEEKMRRAEARRAGQE